MIFPLLLFRIILALAAWTAIFYDNYKHRDLKLVAFAYTSLVLGSIFAYFFKLLESVENPNSEIFLYLTHVFAVLFAGVLFALTAYAAHKSMEKIEEKTKKAFQKV